MTEQEQDALEQAAKPQRWGSKERVALVAEVLRQKRMVRWFAEYLAEAEELDNDDFTADEWVRFVERQIEQDFSPKG